MALTEVKTYLRVDGTDNDSNINAQIGAAEEYLTAKTGVTYNYVTDKLAALFICEKVKSLYFSDYDNSTTLECILQVLIDKANGIGA